MKKTLVYLIAMGICMVFLFQSCSKDNELDEVLSTENFVEGTLDDMQSQFQAGRAGCYTLVFPVDVLFPDQTTVTVDSFAALKTAIMEWKESNPDAEERPALDYPVTVSNSEGELIQVDSKEEFAVYRRVCKRIFRRHKRRSCFRFQFPLSIVFPDSSIVEYEDGMALKMGLKEWRMENGTADGRPNISFPTDILIVADSTIVTVESREELQQIKEDCRAEE